MFIYLFIFFFDISDSFCVWLIYRIFFFFGGGEGGGGGGVGWDGEGGGKH